MSKKNKTAKLADVIEESSAVMTMVEEKVEKKTPRVLHDTKEYVRLYEGGVTDLNEIARLNGVSRSAVYMGLRLNGIRPGNNRSRFNVTREDLLKVLNDPSFGGHFANISDHLDISAVTLANAIKKHDIKKTVTFS